MISYYPAVTLPYFTRKRSHSPGTCRRYFFQSWEDAFWHLLEHGFIQRGVVLLPDFYCLDVVHNMRAHGMKPEFYPLDGDLQPDMTKLKRLIKVRNPTCIIIFHPAGITSNLVADTSWRTHAPASCIFLHDHVHWMKPETEIVLLTNRDIALDSLRKNTPLSGSFLTIHKDAEPIPPPRCPHPLYVISARLRYTCVRTALYLGRIISSPYLIRTAHLRILKTHDDLIGDSRYGNNGPVVSKILSMYLDFSGIKKIKELQVKYYLKELAGLPSIHIPPFPEPGILHALPLVTDLTTSRRIGPALDKLNVWAKFPDSPWSRTRRVFFLPLGPHITPEDQAVIVNTIRTIG